jgi:putative transposase
MARKILTLEEKHCKELIKELLKETPLKNGQDPNNIMKEFIAEIVNGSFEGELGYGKYDLANKETDNSRNGYGDKTLQTS